MKTLDKCSFCGVSTEETSLVSASTIRQGLLVHIQQRRPDFTKDDFICEPDLMRFREEYIESLVQKDFGEISVLEEEVIQSISHRSIISESPDEQEAEELRSFADKMSDALARFGGSWRFLITFSIVLVVWMLVNSTALLIRTFDPYPFIFLNLMLSCLAAVQAPIIMMSQNRQEAKDRLRAQKDYQINLKAELEIHTVQEKMDHLLTQQWQRMTELQQVQIELLQEIRSLQQHSSVRNNIGSVPQ